MARAYILIQTEIGDSTSDVSRQIAAIKGVTRADTVTGPYDIIVQADTLDIEDMTRNVLASIHEIKGIQRTLTCPTLSS